MTSLLDAWRKRWDAKARKRTHEFAVLELELDTLKSKQDVADEVVLEFHAERQSTEYQSAFQLENPLVSICVATYNRAELLAARCLPSLISQTYTNIEIVVVGDCCSDDTAERVRMLGDSRIRYTNLPSRGNYPVDPQLRWMVAGTTPINHALQQARGAWITHLDDDDEHAPERVEKLLSHARSESADLVFHPFEFERPDGSWHVNDADGFRRNQVSTSSIFYHSWLRRLPWDPLAYQYREPGDWNRLRKLRYLGVRASRHPEVLLKHYRERGNSR